MKAKMWHDTAWQLKPSEQTPFEDTDTDSIDARGRDLSRNRNSGKNVINIGFR